MIKAEQNTIILQKQISSLIQSGEVNLYLGEYIAYNKISVQIDWFDLNATDATIQLQQSNHLEAKWNDLSGLSDTLSSVENTVTFENYEFCGKYLNLNIKCNSLTEGILSVFVVLKGE